MVRLQGPVLSDEGVAEVADFAEHGLHESGAQLGRVVHLLLGLLVVGLEVLGGARVEVEGGTVVKELTATLHVPEKSLQWW